MSLRKRVLSRLSRAALDCAGVKLGRTLLAPRYAGNGVIFMLHRVVTDDTPVIYPGYEVPVGVLDSALALVKRSGWDFVSIGEVCRRLRNPGDQRRFACFTFDDGYLDNYTLALPVFAKYSAPMCVYVSTGILDRTMSYWWGGLAALVLRNDEIEVPFPDSPARKFQLRTLQQKRSVYDILDEQCHQNELFLPYLTSAFEKYRIDSHSLLDEHALSTDQARMLARHPLVTIGSHAVTHRRLSSLSESEADSEITASRKELEASLSVPVRHIAYPFGGRSACGEREFTLTRAAGYESGVTTVRGNILPNHRDQAWMLPRHALSVNLSTVRNCLFGTEALLRAL